MSKPVVVNHITFTSDGKTMCVSYSNGFGVYNTYPFEEKFRQIENRQISHAVTLTGINKVVYSGVEGQRAFSDKSVCVFDCSIHRPLTQIDCPETIKGLYMLQKMFAIALKNEVRVYNFEPAGLYTQLRCVVNENAPCDFTILDNNYVIAMCGRQTGALRIVSVEASGSLDRSINAHTHQISHIKFNIDGSMVATSSEVGTIIRVFNSKSGDKICEFRRGSFSATIQSIAFCPNANIIASTSSKNTLHVFAIQDNSDETKRSTASWKVPESNYTSISFVGDNKIIAAISSGVVHQLKYNDELNDLSQEKFTSFMN